MQDIKLQAAIRKARQKSFLSQEELAEEVSVSPSTVTRWETGKAKPNLSALKKLKAFCVNHDLAFDEIENAWFSEDAA